VNQVTPRLFAEVPDVRAMDAAPAERIERLILETGFFRQKTRSLKGAARAILERFGGEVPSRMEDLVTLPGVGRKTANVLLGHVFDEAGLVVDTHVRRLASDTTWANGVLRTQAAMRRLCVGGGLPAYWSGAARRGEEIEVRCT
jgi:endonuclease-3